ncbi:hypothetical protein CEXT_395031 [Caerostris extrusa]|uniref:Uncharacterized protein n=1 Tax=Caerostris extrusa TaxID=172846 RepID=A0AAV4YG68_CAEEX|nr:hypothetical protein CEXT_395031 [Caerostris extrusa]
MGLSCVPYLHTVIDLNPPRPFPVFSKWKQQVVRIFTPSNVRNVARDLVIRSLSARRAIPSPLSQPRPGSQTPYPLQIDRTSGNPKDKDIPHLADF